MTIEEKLNTHDFLCDILKETYRRKNHDYGDSFSETYRKLGAISAVTRISDKYNRMVSLITNPHGQLINDESVTDTLMDLANYCLMFVIELNDKNDSTKINNEQ